MPESKKINQMFAAIAPKYDLANRLLSGCLDCWWRWRLARRVKSCCPSRVLDLATGSGDMAFEMEKQLSQDVSIIGMDFCEPMLNIAKDKGRHQKPPSRVIFEVGDCQKIELPSDGIDVVTIVFGIRNVEDRPKAFREMYRVLRKAEGVLFIMEFSQPQGILKPFYHFYLRQILPILARLITGNRSAYEYLGGSIEGFLKNEALAQELRDAGFVKIEHHGLSGGIVTIHTARISDLSPLK